MLREGGENQGEDLLINWTPQSLANDREAGMIGCALGQVIVQKFADRDRIVTSGRNGPFAGKVFEKTHHHHLQIHHRINAGAAASAALVSWGAERAHLEGEAEAFQGFLQLGVKSGLGRLGHLGGSDPELGLNGFILGGEHNE